MIIHEGTNDFDSDSEGHPEDTVDEDLCYAFSVIPKLQFRFKMKLVSLYSLRGLFSLLNFID